MGTGKTKSSRAERLALLGNSYIQTLLSIGNWWIISLQPLPERILPDAAIKFPNIQPS
jgi:hypothetical protein